MLADEMIRDQLVEKTNIHRVRERLLLESELSLEKAMIIADQIEAVLSDVDMVHLGTGGGIEKVELLQKAQKLTQDTTKELKKLRRLPFAVRNAVSEELKKLVQKDIIEVIRMGFTYSCDWVEAQASFDTVKDLIVHSPALALFDPSLPTIVTTDASEYGLGGVMTQLHEIKNESEVVVGENNSDSHPGSSDVSPQMPPGQQGSLDTLQQTRSSPLIHNIPPVVVKRSKRTRRPPV
uniref:Uncharacterized protein n=1 Tax=Sphaerodactylus townsendi TaxID=933632 RepID=A0ACB8F3L8_9SAUR